MKKTDLPRRRISMAFGQNCNVNSGSAACQLTLQILDLSASTILSAYFISLSLHIYMCVCVCVFIYRTGVGCHCLLHIDIQIYRFINIYRYMYGFPGGSVVKNTPANAGDSSLIPWVRKIPWRRKWQCTPVFLPGKSHGQRSLVGYSP